MDVLLAAGTLWGLFALVLFLPIVGAPSPFRQAAATLLTLQFLALLAAGYGVVPAYEIASRDLPLLALALTATAIWHGVRVHRGQAPRSSRREGIG